MKTKNNEYFIKRAEDRMHKAHLKCDSVVKKLNQAQDKAILSLKKEIQTIINKTADTPQEARALLDEKISNKEYDKLLELFKVTQDKRLKQEIKKRLKAQVNIYHISRKEALINAIERNKIVNSDNQITLITNHLKNVYKSEYLAKSQDYIDIGYSFVDNKRIDETLLNKWLGENYKSRIGKNMQVVAEKLEDEIIQKFIKGKSIKNIVNDLSNDDAVDTKSRYVLNRLVRTETSYVVNMADLDHAKSIGITKRQFIATLDIRTSSKCRGHHGDIVDIKDTKIGINTPPLHPFCRSVMIDYIPGLSDEIVDKETNIIYINNVKDFNFLYNQTIKKEPYISSIMKNIEDKTKIKLAGFEHRIKTKESLTRKLHVDFGLKDYIKKSYTTTNDVLRYTYILSEDNFYNEYQNIIEHLNEKNVIINKVKNTWFDNSQYKGINLQLEINIHKVELQFHTKESFDLKNGILHKLYEEYRDLKTSKSRKKILLKEMIKLSDVISRPHEVEKIK